MIEFEMCRMKLKIFGFYGKLVYKTYWCLELNGIKKTFSELFLEFQLMHIIFIQESWKKYSHLLKELITENLLTCQILQKNCLNLICFHQVCKSCILIFSQELFQLNIHGTQRRHFKNRAVLLLFLLHFT